MNQTGRRRWLRAAGIASFLGLVVIARVHITRMEDLPLQVQDAPERDTFTSPDKAKHFLASGAIAAAFYGAASMAGVPVVPVTAAATLSAGVLKEVYDRQSGTHFCPADVVYDVLGLVAVLGIAAALL